MLKIYTYAPKNYFGSNCYLICSGEEYAVIDPSVDYNIVVSEHPEIEGKVKHILLTHGHFDHILNIKSWTDKCDSVLVGEADGPMLSNPKTNCYLGFLGIEDGYYGEYSTVKDGDIIKLGTEAIEVISCPGHTPGGVSYLCKDSVFVGDTLFERGGYGRTDLPGGDIEMLEKSLLKLFGRMVTGRFYPGHGNSATFEDTIRYFL